MLCNSDDDVEGSGTKVQWLIQEHKGSCGLWHSHISASSLLGVLRDKLRYFKRVPAGGLNKRALSLL